MMKGLTKARSISALNLILLLVATALLSHAASTTNWKRLLGAKDDDFSSVWADFCRALEKAGDSVEFYAPDDDDLDRAEGYRYASVHTNQLRATADADGSVRLVLAQRDPGAANWISTTGHRHGMMLFRWTRPRPDTRYPEIETRLVKLSSLEGSGDSQTR
jgi:hypothetical protein